MQAHRLSWFIYSVDRYGEPVMCWAQHRDRRWSLVHAHYGPAGWEGEGRDCWRICNMFPGEKEETSKRVDRRVRAAAFPAGSEQCHHRGPALVSWCTPGSSLGLRTAGDALCSTWFLLGLTSYLLSVLAQQDPPAPWLSGPPEAGKVGNCGYFRVLALWVFCFLLYVSVCFPSFLP